MLKDITIILLKDIIILVEHNEFQNEDHLASFMRKLFDNETPKVKKCYKSKNNYIPLEKLFQMNILFFIYGSRLDAIDLNLYKQSQK